MSFAAFILIFIVLTVAGVPMAVVFGGMAILPGLLDPGFSYTVSAALHSMYNNLDSFTMLAVPLFMLSGVIMSRGGISEKLFNFFAYFVGRFSAGLPCACVLTCMFYGAISGSSVATVSAVGAMAIPFLIEMGYDAVFSTAIVTVAGGLGVIIPPSVSYIIFASAANSSPGALFTGGIIPGVLIGCALMVCCVIMCRNGAGDKEKQMEAYNSLHEQGFAAIFKDCFWALMTPVIILGSIYGGICSPTEAAAVSVIYSLIVALFIYKTLKISELKTIFIEGGKSYLNILFICMAATAFGRCITLAQYPKIISDLILGVSGNPVVVILILNLVMLVFGMIMDNIPNILILTPILLPIAQAVGMNTVQFGIMMTCNLAIGMVTPPMGMNLYVASGMTNIPVLKISKATIPLILAFLVALAFIAFVPALSLALPGLM